MLIATDRALRAQRRRFVAFAGAFLLATSLVAAHTAVSGGGHMDDAMAICLAVVDSAVVGVAVALAAAVRSRLLELPRAVGWKMPRLTAVSRRDVRTRAGPAALQVFRL
jgi:hypothetical protein